jgi:hypothetical protein
LIFKENSDAGFNYWRASSFAILHGPLFFGSVDLPQVIYADVFGGRYRVECGPDAPIPDMKVTPTQNKASLLALRSTREDARLVHAKVQSALIRIPDVQILSH